MLRVKNLDNSVDFYTRLFGMAVFRRIENKGGRYTVAFLGYGEEESQPAIELTYNWGKGDGYDKGDGFGHIAIGVPDIYGLCDALAAEGVEIPRPAGPNAPIIAFVKDPDGYMIELGDRA